jgi:hypothetical protein
LLVFEFNRLNKILLRQFVIQKGSSRLSGEGGLDFQEKVF